MGLNIFVKSVCLNNSLPLRDDLQHTKNKNKNGMELLSDVSGHVHILKRN